MGKANALLEQRKYGAIYADPPWSFRNWSAKGTGRNAVSIAASPIVFGSASSGLSLVHISNCSAAKRSRDGIAGAIKLAYSMRGKVETRRRPSRLVDAPLLPL
jgi:hypothetical protein